MTCFANQSKRNEAWQVNKIIMVPQLGKRFNENSKQLFDLFTGKNQILSKTVDWRCVVLCEIYFLF